MDRRWFLRSTLLFGGAAMMPEPTTFDLEVERTNFETHRARYNAGDFTAVHGIERQARRLYGLTTITRTSADYNEVARLYVQVAHQLVQILYSAASYRSALFWVEQMQAFGWRLKNPDLMGLGSSMRSLVLKANGEVPLSIVVAERAKSSFQLSPRATAMVEIHLAGAYATGEKGEAKYKALAALERAETQIVRADESGEPLPYWASGMTGDALDYHRAQVIVKAQPCFAEDSLVAAAKSMPEARKLAQAGIVIRRAEAAGISGDPEKAVELVLVGLPVVGNAGLRREVARVHGIRNKLAEYASARMVRQLDDALEPKREVRGSVQWRQDTR